MAFQSLVRPTMADSGGFPRHVPLPGEAYHEKVLMDRLQDGEPSALDELIDLAEIPTLIVEDTPTCLPSAQYEQIG